MCASGGICDGVNGEYRKLADHRRMKDAGACILTRIRARENDNAM